MLCPRCVDFLVMWEKTRIRPQRGSTRITIASFANCALDREVGKVIPATPSRRWGKETAGSEVNTYYHFVRFGRDRQGYVTEGMLAVTEELPRSQSAHHWPKKQQQIQLFYESVTLGSEEPRGG